MNTAYQNMNTAYQNMNIDEICDEIARRLGWTFVQSTNTAAFPHWIDSYGNPSLDAESNYVHPIPQTLEESTQLPEDWIFTGVHFSIKTTMWTATAMTFYPDWEGGTLADTELLARFRLRLFCMIKHDYYSNRLSELITKKYSSELDERETKELSILQYRFNLKVNRELKPVVDALQNTLDELK